MELDDYYSILGVSKSATKEEIETAYRVLAARWDPDKNSDNIEVAEEKFKQILQAYNILNREAIKIPIKCSLEDLYNGASKEMLVSNWITYPSGGTRKVEKMVTIEITRGLANGANIILGGEVSKELYCFEVALVVDEEPHDVFTRDGMDLIVTHKATLDEGIEGFTVLLTTLDDRRLEKRIGPLTHPTDHVLFVENEGMPSSEDPSKRGNLTIKLLVELPAL